MSKLAFLLLCWRAYQGDPVAIVEVAKIIKGKVEEVVHEPKR
jgi:hypothetical protein